MDGELEGYCFKKRLGFLSRACAFVYRVGNTDAQCNVGIFNTFLIKGANIYFGHKDKVYVINKQLIVDVFGMCAEGYVEELKG